MGYRKIGVVPKSRSTMIIAAARLIKDKLGGELDAKVYKIIKSMGDPRLRLNNIFFERTLLIEAEEFKNDKKLYEAFLIILNDFLVATGYTKRAPVEYTYVLDPAMPLDDVLDEMLQFYMPTWKNDELGGDYATVDTLGAYFPEVIRRTALVGEYRKVLAQRFRMWLQNIGHTLFINQALTQVERTALIMYGNPKSSRSLGNTENGDNSVIKPVENKTPEVAEVGAMYAKITLPGPWYDHTQLVSDRNMEQLTVYTGPHFPDAKMLTGYIRRYGPFIELITQPTETITWSVLDLLTALTSYQTSLMKRSAATTEWGFKAPFWMYDEAPYGARGVILDDPEIRITLTDKNDVSRYSLEWKSQLKQRWIHSANTPSFLDTVIFDLALQNESKGRTQIAITSLDNLGIARFDEAIESKKLIIKQDDTFVEETMIPVDGVASVVKVDLKGYYSDIGDYAFLPPGSELLMLPFPWFLTPAERVVDFVASIKNLTISDKMRFSVVISLFHNCARYERLTGRKPPLNKIKLAKALLGT